MTRVLCCFLALSALARADERADRNAIQAVVDALNTDEKTPISRLFTTDADNQLTRLSDLDGMLVPANTPWSEVSRPRIMLQNVRFITPDVALVDAANTQFGSTILVRRVPVLLVMKREATGWRIASLRVMVNLMDLPFAQ